MISAAMMSGPGRLALFRCLLLLLCEREALGLFAAGPAFLHVVSTLAVAHKTQQSLLRRRFQVVSLRAGKKNPAVKPNDRLPFGDFHCSHGSVSPCPSRFTEAWLQPNQQATKNREPISDNSRSVRLGPPAHQSFSNLPELR